MKLNVAQNAAALKRERAKGDAIVRLVKAGNALAKLLKPDGGSVDIKVKLRGRKQPASRRDSDG